MKMDYTYLVDAFARPAAKASFNPQQYLIKTWRDDLSSYHFITESTYLEFSVKYLL